MSGRFGLVFLLSAGLVGCLGRPAALNPEAQVEAPDEEDEHAPEIEEPLALELTTLTLRRGSVTLAATMEEGSADVSVYLARGEGSCDDTHEIGRGFATRTSFVWRFDAREIALAHECNVVVKARARDDEGRRVVRTADVIVAITLTSDDEKHASLPKQEIQGDVSRLTFRSLDGARRLHANGVVIGAEDDDEDTIVVGPGSLATFEVPNLDLAKAVLGRRAFTYARVPFTVSLAVGNLTLDPEAPEES